VVAATVESSSRELVAGRCPVVPRAMQYPVPCCGGPCGTTCHVVPRTVDNPVPYINPCHVIPRAVRAVGDTRYC